MVGSSPTLCLGDALFYPRAKPFFARGSSMDGAREGRWSPEPTPSLGRSIPLGTPKKPFRYPSVSIELV